MAYEEILMDVHDGVATITLNRPDKLNAWTGTMAEEVEAAMTDAGQRADARAIILTGAGRGFLRRRRYGQSFKHFRQRWLRKRQQLSPG